MTISASKFKEQCLSLLETVGPEGIVITKHGKPVAKLLPVGADSRDLIGCLRGRVRVRGRLFSTGVRWRAQS